ncbi:MAG: flagellar biosynthetic protein FliQ [Phycisphaerae bacterium]|nr:flagellar biosynthetic protein FliQ [Phycisphaerae bacterium]MCZ2399659.1 flagellar biosynthetic protein FliQ [Phycisphaerae bacterium]NUQ49642.1 flagellar biosynthetic protein FliQ [Phycisphaerae bacterium]
MDLPVALDLGREALLTALLVAGPVLAAGVIVGVLISLIQTVTQIQDQTFALVPKIVAMFAAAGFFVPWVANQLIAYARTMLSGGY